MIRTSINLPALLHHQLQVVAFGHNQTMSDVVRRLLERSLAQQKDAHEARVCVARKRERHQPGRREPR